MTAGSASCAAAHAPASIFDAIRCVAEKSHARAEVRTRYSSGPCSLAQPISSRMADSIASPGSAASAERAGGPTIASPCSRHTARCRTKSRSPSRSRPSTTFRAERQPPVVMWSWNPGAGNSGCDASPGRHESELETVRRVVQWGESAHHATELLIGQRRAAEREEVKVASLPPKATEYGGAVEIDGHEVLAKRAQERAAHLTCSLVRVLHEPLTPSQCSRRGPRCPRGSRAGPALP